MRDLNFNNRRSKSGTPRIVCVLEVSIEISLRVITRNYLYELRKIIMRNNAEIKKTKKIITRYVLFWWRQQFLITEKCYFDTFLKVEICLEVLLVISRNLVGNPSLFNAQVYRTDSYIVLINLKNPKLTYSFFCCEWKCR